MMKIADVSAHSLSSPIEPPRRYQFNGTTEEIRKRDVVLVAVQLVDGTQGWAPCGTSTFTRWEEFNEATHDDIAKVINDIISPKLQGTSFDDIGDALALINSTNLPEYLRWQARSVIDIALHDIRGKQAGAPIFELLDYEVDPSPELDLYPSSGLYLSPDQCISEATALIERGYRTYKYRAGIGLEEDRRVIERLDEELGDKIEIIVDAHAWWSRGNASYSRENIRSLIELMGRHNVFWVEEPVPSSDYKTYRWLSETTNVPLAGGENEDTPGSLVNMAELGNLSFLNGDVKKHGGYTGCRQALEYAHGRAVSYAPHNYGTNLGVIANAHLAAAAPDCDFIQYPIYQSGESTGMYPFPLASEIITTELDINDGKLTVPTGPGLGVDVNLDILDEYSYVV